MAGPDVETGSEVGKPWDPLGFSKLYDRNFDFNGNMTYPHVQWLRESELKHGRCAMLAIVGIFAQQSFHIAGYPEAPWYEALQKCYDNPQGIVGFGIAQISAFAMVIEGKFFPNDAWIGQMDREPGDLGFDPLKLAKDAESMKSILQLVQTCFFFCKDRWYHCTFSTFFEYNFESAMACKKMSNHDIRCNPFLKNHAWTDDCKWKKKGCEVIEQPFGIFWR